MHIQSFDSWDEMLNALKAREREIDTVCSFQRELLTMEGGLYFASPYEDIVVFGRTWNWTPDKLEAFGKQGESAEEAKYELESYADSLKRGYVFTECWSNPFPDRELGSHHASRLYPISEADFLCARDHNWLLDQATADRLRLAQRIQIVETMQKEKAKMEKKIPAQCPRCGKNTMPVAELDPGALSRLDNETYICSQCGVEEALEQFFFGRLTEEWAVPLKEADDE